eukprot:COSAG04_NODE_285_length_18117_cov_10.869797_10_plen_158_part_00
MPETALMGDAAADDATAVRAALKEGGCELDAREEDTEMTAFLCACSQGSVECMKLLADAGCDTMATAKNGKTALLLASQACAPAAVQLVLENGWGDVEARDERGDTALLWACHQGGAECMTILVDAGCDVTATSNIGQNALMLAALSRRRRATAGPR